MPTLMRRLVPYLVAAAGFVALGLLRPPTIFTVVAAVLLVGHFVMAGARPVPPAGLAGLTARRVTVIVPAYNEQPDMLIRAIKSVLSQDLPARVVVVDDGSGQFPSREVGALGVALIGHPLNRGKREAIASAVRWDAVADIYVTVDSDTVMAPGALKALVAEVGGDVKAATGAVYAANRATNLLTRAQDLIYSVAFLLARQAQSRLGSVVVCSGALAAYDGSMVRDHLDDFLAQRSAVGEDRRLTSYALRNGKVRFTRQAVAYTIVPEKLSHWVRQQVRWARSWARESFLGLGEQRLGGPGWTMMAADIAVHALFTAGLVGSLVVGHRQAGSLISGYLMVALILGPVRSVYYVTERTDLPLQERLLGLVSASLFAVLYTAIGLPARLYGAATAFRSTWGTRQRGVEVS